MTVKSFCELFTAGCLDVEYRGQQRVYRAAADLDLSLLSEPDRIVARRLSTFKSLDALLEEAGEALPEARQELMEQCTGIIDDALAYCPPVSSC